MLSPRRENGSADHVDVELHINKHFESSLNVIF